MARVRTKKRDGNGKPPTPSWKENPSIMLRVKVVEQLWAQGVHRTMEAVNQSLAERDLPPVSYDTVKADRQRVLELYRDMVLEGGGIDNHTVSLKTLISQSLRDALACPPGPLRAPLYAVALRAQEDLMRIDGTWSRGILGLNQPEEPSAQEERFAPDPQELVASGLITQGDVLAHLRILAARTRRLGQGHLQETAGEVIEGTARDVTPAPNRARRPQAGSTAVKAVQAVPRPEPRVPDRGPRRRGPGQAPLEGNGHRHPDLEAEDLDGGLAVYHPSPWE